MKRIFLTVREMIVKRALIPKLIAIILAVILWAYIGSTKMGELAFRIPIEFKSLPSDLMVTRANVRDLTINVSGRKESLKNFNVKSIKAFVNLRKAVIGPDQRYPINITREELPEGLHLDMVRKSIILSIEKRQSRAAKIIPVVTGDVPEGYMVGDIATSPEYVSVYGTDENLRSVDSIKTEAISVAGETKRISREVPLDINSGNGLWVTPEAVSVTVQIVPVANLVVAHRDIVIRKSNENYRYSLQQKDVRIYLKGAKKITPADDEVEASVDMSLVNVERLFPDPSRTSAHYDVPVRVSLRGSASGLTILKVTPGSVSVRITKK